MRCHIITFPILQCNDYLVKDTTFSISNLQHTTEYQFRVLAKNQAGWSAPGKPSDPVVPKAQYSKDLVLYVVNLSSP